MTNHTFVICAYKESPYLEACIESLMDQESVARGDSKIILYTSTPGAYTDDLGRKYNIEVFAGVKKGIGANWNEALGFVDTKYATIAHQDDIYLPDYGVRVLDAFNKNQNLKIVFTDYGEIDAAGQVRVRNINLKIKTLGLKTMSLFNNKTYQRRIYAFGNFISCPAVSYNLEALADFKFDEKLKMTLDWDAWERIMKLPGNIKYLPVQAMYHRIHEDSETSANTVDKSREQEEYLIYRRYWPEFISKLLMKAYVKNQKTNN
ncbi:glycosyltransferase family 2 protein [Streptococcaceae bacterium ESL0729]|nr:glycosyltransferase family 2 protein [Streptococcaceae bacterium ESL0729]